MAIYDSDTKAPGGAAQSLNTPPSAPADNAPSEHESGGGEESSLFLTPDMLPAGMKVAAGDILEFKVVNPADQDGHIEVVYNTSEEGEGGKSWEDGLREEMSAGGTGKPSGETMDEGEPA